MIVSNEMKKREMRVIKLFKLQHEEWTTDANLGHFALTFTSDNWILQYRDKASLKRDLVQNFFFKKLDLPGINCHGEKIILERKDGTLIPSSVIKARHTNLKKIRGYWSVQKRLPGKTCDAKTCTPEQMIEAYKRSLPVIIKELDILAEVKVPNWQKNKLLDARLPRGLKLQVCSTRTVLKESKKKYPSLGKEWDKVPNEKKSPIVLSHGDPTIKNIIMHDNFPSLDTLIDWETIAYLPRHMDYTHSIAQVMKYIPEDQWQELIDYSFTKFKKKLPGWSLGDWRVAVLWFFLRENIYFRKKGTTREEAEAMLLRAPKIVLGF